MSVAFQEHLGQEEKSTSQNISQIPCPSSLLAAASTIKCIMDAADAERKQRAFRDAEGGHEQEGEIDCRWTAGGTASCGQEEEEQHYRRGEIRFHGEQQRPHQHPLHVHHKRTIPLQQRELALQRVPSRRPGRPFRKRGRQVSCREIHGDNASAEVHLQQRLATAGDHRATDRHFGRLCCTTNTARGTWHCVCWSSCCSSSSCCSWKCCFFQDYHFCSYLSSHARPVPSISHAPTVSPSTLDYPRPLLRDLPAPPLRDCLVSARALARIVPSSLFPNEAQGFLSC